MSADPRVLRYELEQIRQRLLSDPENIKLLDLEKKAQRLLDLAIKVQSAGNMTSSQPSNKSIENDLLARKRGKTMAQESRALTRQWNVGDPCECLNNEDAKWYEAMVQSLSADRSHATIVFTGTAEARHCLLKEIRPKSPSSKRKPIKSTALVPGLAGPTTPIGRPPISNAPKKPSASRTERERRKEEEMQVKQAEWQRFAQKRGIAKPRD